MILEDIRRWGRTTWLVGKWNCPFWIKLRFWKRRLENEY